QVVDVTSVQTFGERFGPLGDQRRGIGDRDDGVPRSSRGHDAHARNEGPFRKRCRTRQTNRSCEVARRRYEARALEEGGGFTLGEGGEIDADGNIRDRLYVKVHRITQGGRASWNGHRCPAAER